MKKHRLILLLFSAALLSVSLITIYYYSAVIEKIENIEMLVKVGDRMAFNLEPDKLAFGIVMPSNSADRNITLTNDARYPLYVTIINKGEIARFIRLSDNNFILEPYGQRGVRFEVNIPANTSFGAYKGTAKIVFKKK